MQHSEQFGEIAAALAMAQGKMDHAAKDRSNPAFKSKYADLASVLDACRPHLAEQCIAIVQPPALVIPEEAKASGVVRVETWLIHKSGQWFATSLDASVADTKAQTIGSAITYLRRYGLSAMAGIAPDDDDGNGASKPREREREDEPARREAPREQQPQRPHVQAVAPAPQQRPTATPASARDAIVRDFPAWAEKADTILAIANASDEAKLADLRKLYGQAKAAVAPAPRPPEYAALDSEARKLLAASEHADPSERAQIVALLARWSQGRGTVDGIESADLDGFVAEVRAVLNGPAVAA